MKKIVIVEDDIDTLDLVEIILRDNGYAVIKINREVTVKEIAGINPNLIILDYLTPYGLGSEMCLNLKNDGSAGHIPVILYSASSDLPKLASDSRADDYLTKPFDIADLIDMAKRLAL